MNTTKCPQCGVRIQYKPELAGTSAKCPKCQERFTLPDDDDEFLPVPEFVSPSLPPLVTAKPKAKTKPPSKSVGELMPNFLPAATKFFDERFPENIAIVAWPTVAVYVLGTLFGMGLSSSIDGLTETIPLLNNWFYWALIFVPTCVLYMIPYYVALSRGHRNSIPIGIMTVAFGWTAAAWVCCLAWAFSSNVKETEAQATLEPNAASQTA